VCDAGNYCVRAIDLATGNFLFDLICAGLFLFAFCNGAVLGLLFGRAGGGRA
jgi:hypothetical protein